jgi:1,4-dihydroxy-2-naphthoyl-CoA hydrolase
MMTIWKIRPTVEQLNALNGATIHEALGIRFRAVGDDYLEATMPVDARTKQPFGFLHGGASVVLAESLGSVASGLVSGSRNCVGIEVNANHLRPAEEGFVTGRVTAIRLGKTLHVWEIRILAQDGSLVCVSRLTVMVRKERVPAT